MEPGAAKTIPLSNIFLSTPLKSRPTLSPARPSSSNLRNISIPVTTVLPISGRSPTISTVSFNLTLPRSILPVPTVPRPSIEKTSSTAIRNGLSRSLLGSGIKSSTAFIKSRIGLQFGQSSLAQAQFMAFKPEPLIMGVLSPGKLYLFRRSLTSISTRSINSLSSTISTLFRKTTIDGTFTWRAKRICSLVWGIGPSAAETTKIAPSIWAAPVIIFLM